MEPAPLGFAAASARAAAPTLLCLVRLSKSDAGKAEEAVKKGADAVIVEGLDAGKARDVAKKAGEAFFGGRPEKATRGEVAAMRDGGADFVVLDLHDAADGMLEEKIGLVLSLEDDVEDMTLRLLGELGIDALIVPGPGDKLSVSELLGFRRLATLARAPLLTEVKGDADADLLQALREAGVAGVIVGAGDLGKLEGLRQRVAGLPARGRKKEERAEAMLPAGVGAGSGDHEHEDDDD